MFGTPAEGVFEEGVRSGEWFEEDGEYFFACFCGGCWRWESDYLFSGTWKVDMEISQDTSLEKSEERLEGENKAVFLRFMRGMLQWRPEDRKTAKELFDDPWLNGKV